MRQVAHLKAAFTQIIFISLVNTAQHGGQMEALESVTTV